MTSFFSTSGNQIVDGAGHNVQIAGVNWFGLESPAAVPHGLWARPYMSIGNGQGANLGMMDQMVQLGFNTIRLEFASDTLTDTAQYVTAQGAINYALNPG